MNAEEAYPPVVVRQNRVFAAQAVILCLVMLAGSVLALLSPFKPDDGINDHVARFISAYFGPPVSLIFLIYSLKRLLSVKPLLIADSEGITTRGFGLILWEEIAEVKSLIFRGRRWLAIVPRDVDVLAKRLSPKLVKRMRWNFEQMGMMTGFYEKDLSVPLDSILSEINTFFANQDTANSTKLVRITESSLYVLEDGDVDISGYSLREKRVAIKCYRRKRMGNDAFGVRGGKVYEGCIMVVNKASIIFEWGVNITYGGPTELEPEIEIPIDDIILLKA